MDNDEPVINNSDLVWANEVLTVYKHLGQVASKRTLGGSSSAKHLHDLVTSDPKFEVTFLTTMVPKATEIVGKARKEGESESIVVPERRAIAELQALVNEAVAESKV